MRRLFLALQAVDKLPSVKIMVHHSVPACRPTARGRWMGESTAALRSRETSRRQIDRADALSDIKV